MEASIKSAHDGAELVFSQVRTSPDGELDSFVVGVRSANLKCSAKVYGYMSDGLPAYFSELDNLMNNFGGWEGARTWSSLEGELEISASADSLGHVTTKVKLRSGHYELDWTAEAGLLLEAGQLSRVAKDVGNVFASGAA